MNSASCLNCGMGLMPAQHFCPHCGQKVSTGRLTFKKLGIDFLQTFVKVERGFFRLVKGLTLRPGETAMEYVQGRRKAYFSPLAFMGLCVALMLFINNWLKPYTIEPQPLPEILARISNPKDMELYLLSLKRIGEFTRFGNQHMNTLSVLLSPWFAFFLWLFFRRKGWNMAEITVAYILFSAFSNAVSSLIITPVLSTQEIDSMPYNFIMYGSMLLQTLYIAWGMKVFFHYHHGAGYWKVLAVLFLAGAIGFILLVIGFFFYVYRGEANRVLRFL